MIYLLKELDIDKNNPGRYVEILKIGYASDMDSRVRQYATHAYYYEVLDTREGDLELESAFHIYFKKYQLKTEWFEYNDEIVNGFKTLTDKELLDFYEKSLLKGEQLIPDFVKENEELLKFYNDFFFIDKNFERRMKLYCEYSDENGNEDLKKIEFIPKSYHEYYNTFGHKTIKAQGYKEANLRVLMINLSKSSSVASLVYSVFNEGESYKLTEIISVLKDIYDKLGIKKVARAVQIKEFFKTEDKLLYDKVTKNVLEGLNYLIKFPPFEIL